MSSMFGGKAKVEKPPAPTPLPDEDAIRRAKMKDMARSQTQRGGGRESTIFTDYSGENLG